MIADFDLQSWQTFFSESLRDDAGNRSVGLIFEWRAAKFQSIKVLWISTSDSLQNFSLSKTYPSRSEVS
jgi:hypothetical protein